MKHLFILVSLLLGSVAYGQSLEFTAGASSLLSADGASAIYSTPTWGSEVSVGIAANHFVYGAGGEIKWRGCNWFVGDHQESFSTAVAGISASTRGVSMDCKTKTHDLQVFTGAAGLMHSTPYFTAMNDVHHFGSGVQYTQILGDFTVTGVSAIVGNDRALLEDVKYKHKAFTAEEAAGLAMGQRYFEGQAQVTEYYFSASLTHADYFGLNTTLNAEQVTVGTSRLSGFASAFQSNYSGEAFGAQGGLGLVSATVMHLISHSTRQTNEFVTEQISRHILLNQAISGKNVGFGGTYTENLISGGVSYQELFVPAAGFERAMVFNLRLQLPRGTVNLAFDMLPSGYFYTGYAGIVAQGPSLAGGGPNANAAP